MQFLYHLGVYAAYRIGMQRGQGGYKKDCPDLLEPQGGREAHVFLHLLLSVQYSHKIWEDGSLGDVKYVPQTKHL